MPFPKSERVIYENNPLKLVVCQLRFPVELKIEMGMTADFREQIRSRFPLAEEDTNESDLPIPDELAEFVPKELVDSLSLAVNRSFQFKTIDRIWTISLSRNFVALETSSYVNWEEFREYLQLALLALVQSYGVQYFTRIGLRYVNVIDRFALELQNYEWHDILEDFIVGPLALQDCGIRVAEHQGTFLVELNSPEDVVRIRHGLIENASSADMHSVYVLDNDFFTVADTLTEVDNVIGKVDEYNTQNRRLFRSCIKQRLHTAMAPKL